VQQEYAAALENVAMALNNEAVSTERGLQLRRKINQVRGDDQAVWHDLETLIEQYRAGEQRDAAVRLLADVYDRYWEKQHRRSALQVINRIIELAPDTGLAYHTRGDLYEQLDNVASALADRRQAVALRVEYPLLFTSLA
jgi:regulator of sirC expression with transglutaminase-like and TPR domain